MGFVFQSRPSISDVYVNEPSVGFVKQTIALLPILTKYTSLIPHHFKFMLASDLFLPLLSMNPECYCHIP